MGSSYQAFSKLKLLIKTKIAFPDTDHLYLVTATKLQGQVHNCIKGQVHRQLGHEMNNEDKCWKAIVENTLEYFYTNKNI